MSASVSFLMALHCHQPVGNFGFVFDEAFRKAYEPFVAALERHPAIRVALHYSGPLLDWCEQRQPDFLERVRVLIRRGQVELLAAGYYEPILPIIPAEDREGQIQLMQARLEQLFGARASGLWLTERVWEPELPESLARCGIRYSMLDTNQFAASRPWLAAALQDQDGQFWDLLGSYTTEYAGSTLRLFPMSKRLRYWIPFQEVDKTVEFLRRAARPGLPVAVTYADDGEKFGLWPKTHEWVYQQGWLERFFQALERESSWLSTTTFSEYARQAKPGGRVYLACGSYEEMLEWSGGNFRNFLIKYPESQAMYQKMLGVSRALRESRAGASKPRIDADLLARAQHELYMAQCNDAYWHGVFGGLYLGNLRRVVYEHLLKAESLLRRARREPDGLVAADADSDGAEELAIRTEQVGLLVDLEEQGAITEWAHYPSAVNLCDVLTRRHEPYHDKLRARQAAAVGTSAPQSIHDALRVKEEGLESHLVYDDARRASFRDHGLSAMPSLAAIRQCAWSEYRLWSGGAWRRDEDSAPAKRAPLAVRLSRGLPEGRAVKTIEVEAGSPTVRLGYTLEGAAAPVVALEFNLGLRDEQWAQPRWQDGVREVVLTDPSVRLTWRMRLSQPAAVASFPIETISDSEEGLGRTYQGLALVCLWDTAGSRSWSTQLTCAIEQSR